MSTEGNSYYSLEVLDSLQDSDVQNFTGLLEVLTSRSQEADQVLPNLERAVSTKTTTVLATRQGGDGPIVATSTLNQLPVLTDEGSVMWIDDVVVNPEFQGKGLSRSLMDFMETEASLYSSHVLLTSKPQRGPARAGYTKRGYKLPKELSVFRNTNLNVDHPSDISPLTDYTDYDVETMALLLKQDPETLELNLRAVLESVVSAVFIKKYGGRITAIATANLCPIPTGSKPWIDDYAGVDAGDKLAVLDAGEQWLAAQEVPYVNMVALSGDRLSENYKKRTTGLFIKQLKLTSTQS